MATWVDASWEVSDETGLPRADRRHGPYRQYLPDTLAGRPLVVSSALAHQCARAERVVRELGSGPRAAGLEGLARFLLRSEAIASSQIEGIAPSPQQVALAELAQDEEVRGFSDQARLVANNTTVLRRASRELAVARAISVGDVEALHRVLLPQEHHHGLRRVQNWIGGSSWHPLDAQFVPPPPERVPALMSDLVTYVNGGAHAPLIQAALTHAQFETIHPFTDGNGRVGRALIHTVLTRRGLTPSAILPVSLVLGTLRATYVEGLTAYRYDGHPDARAAHEGTARWIEIFLDAVEVAAEQVAAFAAEVAALTRSWTERLSASRAASGLRPSPRAGSATSRLVEVLPEVPVLTARTVQRLLGVSHPAARGALEELADAGVLHRRSVERGTTGYSATEVFALLGHAERQLASTQFDTRLSPPRRPVPALPSH